MNAEYQARLWAAYTAARKLHGKHVEKFQPRRWPSVVRALFDTRHEPSHRAIMAWGAYDRPTAWGQLIPETREIWELLVRLDDALREEIGNG